MEWKETKIEFAHVLSAIVGFVIIIFVQCFAGGMRRISCISNKQLNRTKYTNKGETRENLFALIVSHILLIFVRHTNDEILHILL